MSSIIDVKTLNLTIKLPSAGSKIAAGECSDVVVDARERLPRIVTGGVALPFNLDFYVLVGCGALGLFGDTVVDDSFNRVLWLFDLLFTHNAVNFNYPRFVHSTHFII